jgi:tetraprenyl-beta-curcumene synthase
MRDMLALLVMLGRYWRTVFPVSRRELRRWERRAATIPDPVLRAHAGETLRREQGLCEGAALFATLVPCRRRVRVVRLLVAFEVMCDYLDTLAEQPTPDPLANGRQLHRALSVALGGAAAPPGGYYAKHPQHDDGGYLEALVGSCRAAFAALPSAAAVAATAARAAFRSGEGQSHNHAAMLDPRRAAQLSAWCAAHAPADGGLRWWECAAAACSSLTMHALLAAAADPATTAADAARIDAAYFPWIGALSSLLDSVADRDVDVRSGNHSYVAHYPTPADAAHRLAAITRRALAAARELPHGRQHVTILSAMTCFFLSGPQGASPAARCILAQLDGGTRILSAMLRLRQALA